MSKVSSAVLALALWAAGAALAAPPGGRIGGRVTDQATGDGIPDVQVAIYDSEATSFGTAVTDADGYYVLADPIPAGTYRAATYNWDGYINEVYEGHGCGAGCAGAGNCVNGCNLAVGRAVTVVEGATTGDIDFALDRGGRIAGRVTDSVAGTAIAGAWVGVYRSPGLFVAAGVPDATGAYVTAAGLPDGDYIVRTFNSSGYLDEKYDNQPCLNCTVGTGTPVRVTAGATTPNIDFALDRGGRVSGTVRDAATGNPIAGAIISVGGPPGVLSDASGAYLTGKGLPTGTYRAFATVPSSHYFDQSSAEFNVTAGQTTSGIDIALSQGGRIAGTVTSSATGLPVTTDLWIFFANGMQAQILHMSSTSAYTSILLQPGTYYAYTRTPLGYADEVFDNLPCEGCDPRTGTPIVVSAGVTTSGVNFALDPQTGAGISGFGPAQGTVGTRVRIRGEWFFDPVTVSFNGRPSAAQAPCPGPSLGSPPEPGCVDAVVPLDATTGPITVATEYASADTTTNFVVLPGPGRFTVITGADSAPGSLRWTLAQAQAHPGVDFIDFRFDIRPCITSPLVITHPVVVSGTPGLLGYPTIVGPCTGAVTDVFRLAAGSSGTTIEKVQMFGFSGTALTIEAGSTDNWIQDNWIGHTPRIVCIGRNCFRSGTILNRTSHPESRGVHVLSDRNVVRGNTISGVKDGILVGDDPAAPTGGVYQSNAVQNNAIGTDPAGASVTEYGNTKNAITLGAGARENFLGPGNVLSGNFTGVALLHATNVGNVVFDSRIGLSRDGNTRLGNGGWGVFLAAGANGNAVGGAAGGNVVAGNSVAGVGLGSDALGPAVGNWIQSNVIGMNAAQTAGLLGQGVGIALSSGSTGNVVEANAVAGNDTHGVCLWSAQSNGIYGNWIGATATGTPIANGAYGLCFIDSGYNFALDNVFGTNQAGNLFISNSPGLVIR